MFKNLQFFALKNPEGVLKSADEQKMSQKLEAFRYAPASKHEATRMGWINPMTLNRHDDTGLLAHVCDGVTLITLMIEEKVLPAAVIKSEVNERVHQLEVKEMRKLRAKEKAEIKEDVYAELLPKAFSKYKTVSGFIDHVEDRIVVDASSSKSAETFIEMLRETLGTLPVYRINTGRSPASCMTDWVLSGELPFGFHIGERGKLVNRMSDAVNEANFKGQYMGADEVMECICSGAKMVAEIEILTDAGLSFRLTDGMEIKGFDYRSLLMEMPEWEEAEDFATQFDVVLYLVSRESRDLFEKLVDAFGGECQRRGGAESLSFDEDEQESDDALAEAQA